MTRTESEKPSKNARNALRFVTTSSITVSSPAVLVALDDRAVIAELREHRIALHIVDGDAHGSRLLVPHQPGSSFDVIVRTEVGRRFERVGLADGDVAIDTVGTKRANGVAIAVEADDVPMTAFRRQAPRFDRATDAPICERHHRAASECFEQCRERGRDRQRARSVRPASPPALPSFISAPTPA